MTQTDFLQGKCPNCGEDLQIPSHLKQFSCMFCGTRLTPDDIATVPAPAETYAAEDLSEFAAYYRAHVLELITFDSKLYLKVNRADYVPTFERYMETCRPMFIQLEKAVLGGALTVEEAAVEFLDQLEAHWQKNKKWAVPMNRTNIMENDKFSIAIFTVPMIMELKLSISEPYCKALHANWMQRHPKSPFSIGDFDTIAGGFRKKFLGLCFITTAVCLHEGKSDDCAELMAFRGFRDGYLRGCPDGPALIERYYDIAPGIVARIELSNGKSEQYADIRSRYLTPCYEDIQDGRMEKCKTRYTEMVEKLEKKYLS